MHTVLAFYEPACPPGPLSLPVCLPWVSAFGSQEPGQNIVHVILLRIILTSRERGTQCSKFIHIVKSIHRNIILSIFFERKAQINAVHGTEISSSLTL